MALDLFCYSSLPIDEAEAARSLVAAQLESKCGGGLVHYRVRAADEIDREIASEFGLRAASKFLISVNDKQALASELPAVAVALKLHFGPSAVIVLLNNETPLG